MGDSVFPAMMTEMGSSMRLWKGALSLLLVLPLAACLGETPERARIVEVELLRGAEGAVLEVTQELRFSRTMREALSNGIPLRLAYRIQVCGAEESQVLQLSYSPLNRRYEMQRDGAAAPRTFARRNALLAALDRVQLPLRHVPEAGCRSTLMVALDLTALPTPLRFPAFLQPEQWRLVSPRATWFARSPRA
jgi:Domain of unknown function (DUF4390)